MDMDTERFKVLSLSDPDSVRSPRSTSTSSSPSGKLPVELLSEIFLLCVGTVIDEHHTILMPLLVSKICSSWRSAAIANPKLWSRLFLELAPHNFTPSSSSSSPRSTSPSPSSSTSQKNMVETWLARSGACPLTVYVLWEGSPNPLSFTHPVLDALVDHCTRWHTMFFYLPFPAFRSFSRVRNRLPILTELSLGMNDRDMISGVTPGEDSKVDIFENAPRLRSLECVNFSPTMSKFPWNQLQDIPLLPVTIDEALDILHRANRLVNVKFIFVDVGNSHAASPLPNSITALHRYIDHNHLRCFTLMTPRWNEIISLRPLFPHLAFPQLESLTICNLKSPFGPEFTQFLSQLHVLKTLHLRRTALSDEQLVEGLKYLPLLTSLIVHSSESIQEPEPTVTRYLFSALTRNFFSSSSMDDDGMLLPRLKNLEMTLSSQITLAALYDLLEMLQSRLREDGVGVVKLENVRLKSYVELDEEFLIDLIELRDFGLVVFVEPGVGEHGIGVEELQ
jgi:hypothetical protein